MELDFGNIFLTVTHITDLIKSHFYRYQCEARCQPDCFSMRYQPRVLASYAVAGDEGLRIDLLFPTDHRLVQHFFPRMTFVDLFTGVMEMLLFWLLVSPLPFVLIEKTIISLIRSEEELKERRNGVRPYVAVVPAVTSVAPAAVAATTTGVTANGNFNHSMSMESSREVDAGGGTK
jgi:hypothetical protein